jgi:hypothetical protein
MKQIEDYAPAEWMYAPNLFDDFEEEEGNIGFCSKCKSKIYIDDANHEELENGDLICEECR